MMNSPSGSSGSPPRTDLGRSPHPGDLDCARIVQKPVLADMINEYARAA